MLRLERHLECELRLIYPFFAASSHPLYLLSYYSRVEVGPRCIRLGMFSWCILLQPVPTASRTYTPFAFVFPPDSLLPLAPFSCLIVTYRIAFVCSQCISTLASLPSVGPYIPRGIVH